MLKKFEKVRDFNKMQAEILISEGILDFNFIKDPHTNIISLRLSKYVVKKV